MIVYVFVDVIIVIVISIVPFPPDEFKCGVK